MNLSTVPVRAHLWYSGHGPRQFAFLLARLHPSVQSLNRKGDSWCVEMESDSFYLSDPRQITRIVGLGARMRGRVLRKYTYPGFVEVEQNDTVVDVGAFIGEFARPAGEIGDRVVAVEPDERNAAALRRNLQHLSKSTTIEKAAWRETGEHSFQIAGDPSEGSILEVDSNDLTDIVTLDATRIDDLATDTNLNKIDYLKVEAEGAEPEVLEGIGDLPVRKIAVECAPERSGQAPVDEVIEWVRNNGYIAKKQGHIVFARRKPIE